MSYPDGISCIIVSYKSLENLKECVKSLWGQGEIEFEIVVVDNNSRDGTADFLKRLDIKHILLDRNRGFGAAVNLGAQKAEFKYLFILNPDTVVPQGSLRKLYEIAESEIEFGLIAPALKYPNGAPQLSARSLPRRRDFLFGRGSPLYRLGITGEDEAGYIVPKDNSPMAIPAVSATAILIKTELFVELGGFDKRFFMYLEDIDLCHRIRDRGLPIILVPEVRIKHSWRKSSVKRPYFTSYHHHLSVLKYFLKYDKKRFIMNSGLALFLGAGLLLSALMIFIKRASGR